VGRPEIDRQGRWMAAVLSCASTPVPSAGGPTAVLSHRAAAAHWGMIGYCTRVDVSVRTCSHREVVGVRVHRRPGLRSDDVTVHDGIPETTPVQTLVDLAGEFDEPRLERTVNEADRLDLVDPETLLRALEDYPARRGVARLRALLGAQVFRLTASELERKFLRLVRRARLPVPQTGTRLNGFAVDFHWPQFGLVVETDGLRYHRTPAQQARDRERDQAHTAAGLTQLRFTHAQVLREPARVGQTLRAVIRRLEVAGTT
jgi:very-short-patch-repair endonuclease